MVSRVVATGASPVRDVAAATPRSDRMAGRDGRSPAIDRVVATLLVLTIAANLVYLAALLLPGDPASVLVDDWLSDIAEGIPVLVCWLVAIRIRFARPEVVLAAAALTCNLAADVYYGLAMGSDGDLPSPSPADLGYLLFYPLLGAALVVTVIRRSGRLTRSVALDVALASLGSASLLAVILGPTLGDAMTGATAAGSIVAALYPLFDLVLIAAVVGAAASPVLRVGPRAPFLVCGLLVFTGADIVYALQEHAGTYRSGTPLDAAWTVGVVLIAVWVMGAARPAAPDRPSRRTRLLPVPAFAVVAGLVVLLVASQVRVSLLALALAGATIALAAAPVMLRQADLMRMLTAREEVVDRLVALDKARNDMIATVNHEMRTPLTSISGYLELVIDEEAGPIPPAAQQMLRVAQSNAGRLQDLMADMLMTTRLGADRGPDLSTGIRLDELLLDVVAAARPLADSRGVALDLDAPLPVTVGADRELLGRAVGNVVENAVKFSQAAGSVRVTVRTATTPEDGAVAVVCVTDTGMGIPADDLPSLFERFFRAANARAAAIPGSGLGLAIARGIVEAHRGTISAESVEGEGTTVRLTLPVAPEADSTD